MVLGLDGIYRFFDWFFDLFEVVMFFIEIYSKLFFYIYLGNEWMIKDIFNVF